MKPFTAVGVERFGGPEALQPLAIGREEPGHGEFSILVKAAAVNPVDTLLRSGAVGTSYFAGRPPPYIPGMDTAGVVEQVGAGVEGLTAGQRVMAVVLPREPRGGAYTQRLVVPANRAVAIPDSLPFTRAATLPMNGLTVLRALELLGLSPGQVLGVTGAAGAVGGYAIQLGKAAGLIVVADAAPADENLVSDLGADIVVPRGDDVGHRMREAVTGRHGVDGLVDAALLGNLALVAVRDGGAAAIVRGIDPETTRDVTLHRVGVSGYVIGHPELVRGRLEYLLELVGSGQVSLRVAAEFPLEKASDAHRLLEAGGVRGRIVLTSD